MVLSPPIVMRGRDALYGPIPPFKHTSGWAHALVNVSLLLFVPILQCML